MKFLVDTDVISETRKAGPSSIALDWWQRQSISEIALSAISIHEIRQGIELLPNGARRNAIEIWLQDFVLANFVGRILPADAAIADMSGRLVVTAKRKGHNADLADALIAATARVHNLTLATLNQSHFGPLGVPLVRW